MSHGVVALLTDFGHQDGFSGVMKGVILSIYRQAVIVDVAHGIPAQDVRHASWVLDQAFDHFPPGTVFLCVVDPHVGSPHQRQLALYLPGPEKGLVLPDNGLATRILGRVPQVRCVSLTNPSFFRSPEQPSQTFHGRDIYAPVAAHLAKAVAQNTLDSLLGNLGEPVHPETLERIHIIPPASPEPGCWEGQIDVVDTYGNLITNIPSSWIKMAHKEFVLEVGGLTYNMLYVSHYGEPLTQADKESVLALVPGSHGMIEIMSPCASAKAVLQVGAGTPIRLLSTATFTSCQGS